MTGGVTTSAELCEMTATELLEAYRTRAASPVEALEAVARRCAAVAPQLRALTATAFERAPAEARTAERAYARGGRPRSLEGVPFAVKDLFDSDGIETAYGSPLFAGQVPARDAAAVRLAREAGAILVAKTSTDEFAYGITSNNPHLGAVRNPWAPDRVSGGSSGGSAAALAADIVPLALGSDTGGSIRVPAGFCGVVGMKATYGAVPVDGLFPMARTLDHAGPMARSPRDAALLLEVLTGGTFMPARARVRGMRVGVCRDLHLVPLAPDVAAVFDTCVATLAALGARVVEVAFPSAREVFDVFLATQRAETLFTHRRAGLYPARRDGYGDDVRARLDTATRVTLDDYLAAQAERDRLRDAFDALLASVDVLVTPLGSVTPAPIDAPDVEEVVRLSVMDHTVPQNLFGVPACAVRAGFDNLGVPVGVQFVARESLDAVVLGVAQAWFEATGEMQGRRPSVTGSDPAPA